MTQEKIEAEPPDQNPRGLTYFLNGKGSPRFLVRFAEANDERGETYLLKVDAVSKKEGQRIIFRYDGTDYTCIDCNSKSTDLPISRDILGDLGNNGTTIHCCRGPYCPNCEVYPKFGRLPSIKKRDLEESVRAYEELEKKGIQQTI